MRRDLVRRAGSSPPSARWVPVPPRRGTGGPQGPGQRGGGRGRGGTHRSGSLPGGCRHGDGDGGVPIPALLRWGSPRTPPHPLYQPPPANKNKLTCTSVNFPASIHRGLITAAVPGAGGSGVW